jgi:hypothetical protein
MATSSTVLNSTRTNERDRHTRCTAASMMITSYGGEAGAVCAISSWGAGVAWIKCRDRYGNLARPC